MKRIKIACVVAFIIFGIFSFTADERLLTAVESNPGGPPPGVTGAPGETTCMKCHLDSGGGSGQFSIIAPASYVPGQAYLIQVRHQTMDSSRRRWGFELTALADTTPAGTFADLSSQTRSFEDLGRRYVSHTIGGTFQGQQFQAQWSFNWTAPAVDVGPVTFYAAGNQANNDNTNEGDQIYTAMAFSNPGTGPTPTPTPAASPTPTPAPTPTPTPLVTPTPTPTPVATPTPTPTPTPAASPTPTPSPSPTPGASATITGRVFTPTQLALRNAVVTLIDSQNVRRTATTSSFGVYTFTDVPHGNYTLTVFSKRYRFTPNIFTLNANSTIDFVGLE